MLHGKPIFGLLGALKTDEKVTFPAKTFFFEFFMSVSNLVPINHQCYHEFLYYYSLTATHTVERSQLETKIISPISKRN